MKSNVKSIPDGFNTVNTFLIVDGADQLIQFMVKGLGGKQTYMLRSEDNRVWHASVQIGTSTIMISDTMEGMEPRTAMIYLYVDDADALHKKAVQAGGEQTREVKDEFYGDRAGCVKDRWGNEWWIATQVEDPSEEELRNRAEKVAEQQKQETH